MDKVEVAKQKYINVLVGSLETPTGTYTCSVGTLVGTLHTLGTFQLVLEYLPFESCNSVNSGFVLHTCG